MHQSTTDSSPIVTPADDTAAGAITRYLAREGYDVERRVKILDRLADGDSPADLLRVGLLAHRDLGEVNHLSPEPEPDWLSVGQPLPRDGRDLHRASRFSPEGLAAFRRAMYGTDELFG